MFALEANEILQATPPKLRREMGMCSHAATKLYLVHTYSSITRVLVRTRVSCGIVPGAAYPVPGTRCMHKHNQATGSEVRGAVWRGKAPFEQGLVHHRQMLQAEQRLPYATEEKETRSFPMERGSIARYHPTWKPQCSQKSRKFLCPK